MLITNQFLTAPFGLLQSLSCRIVQPKNSNIRKFVLSNYGFVMFFENFTFFKLIILSSLLPYSLTFKQRL